MKDLVLYIHGKGGSPAESEHYTPLFPDCDVVGLDYCSDTPWEAGREIREAVEGMRSGCENIILIANSIGAYFAMCAGIDPLLKKAYFISPIVDMEKLITDMMDRVGVTEDELKAKGMVATPFGEDLSWDYLRYVRDHPVMWTAPTEILCGSRDHMTAFDAIAAFAEAQCAGLTVMEGGEHWFHTAEQMRFLDNWITEH